MKAKGLRGARSPRIMRAHLADRIPPPTLLRNPVRLELNTMGLTKVWVEDGCILCNLCPEVAPEVFVLEDEHCWARPDADLDENEEEIRQAAIDCPVGVIHFEEE